MSCVAIPLRGYWLHDVPVQKLLQFQDDTARRLQPDEFSVSCHLLPLLHFLPGRVQRAPAFACLTCCNAAATAAGLGASNELRLNLCPATTAASSADGVSEYDCLASTAAPGIATCTRQVTSKNQACGVANLLTGAASMLMDTACFS